MYTNRHVVRQRDGGKRTYFIRAEEMDCSWRCSGARASRHNNPAEPAARHAHGWARSVTPREAVCRTQSSWPWKHPQGQKKHVHGWEPWVHLNSISRRALSKMRMGRCLEKALFKVHATPRDTYHSCRLQLGQ